MPIITTICGSMRYYSEMLEVAATLTLADEIVVMPFVDMRKEQYANLPEETKQQLDELHRQKIDMSDGIYVVDVDGYIGESTRREIGYANRQNKSVRYHRDYHRALRNRS